MKPGSFNWLLVVFSVLVLLTGCFYNNVREVEPNQSFDGLNHVLQDKSNLNVVFVHGMGHHPFGEKGVLEYQIEIAKQLGFVEADRNHSVKWKDSCDPGYTEYSYFSEQEKKLLLERQTAGQAICPLKINDVVVGFIGWRQYYLKGDDMDDGKTLNLFELSWDRATELLQKTILELDEEYFETVELVETDELNEKLKPLAGGRDREADRALINRWLKKFVNQKLGDPAIYLGAYGDSIRQVVAEGLSKIAEASETAEDYAYSIVSDSLGSRVVFDTLGCALEEQGCEEIRSFLDRSDTDKKYLADIAVTTTQVFMNANQLPFLALSNVRPPVAGETEAAWLKRFPCETGGPGLASLVDARKDMPEAITIVAFTDPNDALSYHLTKRFLNKCTHLGGEEQIPVSFINVRISNVKWDFGIFANPVKAHSDGFRRNKKAVEMLVNGYQQD